MGCFAVHTGIPLPHLLKNFLKRLNLILVLHLFQDGDPIAGQKGVLLLNATLTVAAHQPGSHQKRLEEFTDVGNPRIIRPS